jgi:hypothetical protein
MSGLRPLPSQAPRPCAVVADGHGRPQRVDGRAVEAVREEWRVEEGWWAVPVRRRCFAVVLEGGRLAEVHEDRRGGRWWRHGG